MQTFTGTIAKVPTVGAKQITSAIKITEDSKPIQIVAFKNYCPAQVTTALTSIKIGDTFCFIGRQKKNPATGQQEIVIEKLVETKDLKYAIDPNLDFIIGGLSSFNNKPISLSEPREGCKQYYTDGDFYWYEGHKEKCPTSF